MSAAPEHVDEARRLAALGRLGVLDSAPEERFDRLTRLATVLCGTPIALISLVDARRQWFKSATGLDVRETPRDLAFCAHAIIGSDSLFSVEDATADVRFQDNPLVTGDPNIRFYAGRVLRDREGLPLGTLCVIDREKRSLDDTQRQALHDLADIVEQELQRSKNMDLLVRLEESERQKALILETLNEGLILQDCDGRVLEWNPAAERILERPIGDLRGSRTVDRNWNPVSVDGQPWPASGLPAVQAMRTGRTVRDAVCGMDRPSGERVWVRVTAQPTFDPGGEPTGVLTAFTDITTEYTATQMTVALGEQLRAAVENSGIATALIDSTGSVAYANDAFADIVGRPSADLVDQPFASFVVHDDPLAQLRPGASDDQDTAVDFRLAVADSHERWIRVHRSQLRSSHGTSLLLQIEDVTDERRMTRELARFSHLFEHANDVITVVDAHGHVRYASPSSERVLGYPDGYRTPDGILGLVHPDDMAPAMHELQTLIDGTRGEEPFSLRVRAYNGTWRHLECVGVNLLEEPDVGGIVITARDTTDRQRLAEQLAHQADHDALTDLPNRRVLQIRLEDALARAQAESRQLAVCFVDLDRFKAVNDTLGHAAGDRLLVEVAEVIRGMLRPGDTAARVGGDEFVVILDPVAGEVAAKAVAERIRTRLVQAAAATGEVEWGASIGVAMSGPDDSPSDLLNRADAALYEAKSRRPNRDGAAPVLSRSA